MESADETTDLWRPSKAIWSNELRLKLWLKFQNVLAKKKQTCSQCYKTVLKKTRVPLN